MTDPPDDSAAVEALTATVDVDEDNVWLFKSAGGHSDLDFRDAMGLEKVSEMDDGRVAR